LRKKTENSSEKSISLTGIALVVGAATLWGTLGPSGKQLRLLEVDMMTVVFFRAFLGALVTALYFAGTSPRKLIPRKRDFPLLFFYGAFSVSLMYAGFFFALNTISVALTEVIFYTFPLMIALFSFAITRERPSKAQYCAAILTFAGVSLAVLPSLKSGFQAAPAGIFWAFGAACACASYMLLGRKAAHTGNIDAGTLFLYGMVFGTLALGGAKTFFYGWQDVLQGFSLPQWGWLLYVCLGGSLGGYSLFYLGIPKVPATVAGVVSAVEVLVAISLSAALNKEIPFTEEFLGAGLIILSILVAALGNRIFPHKHSS